MQKQRCSVIPNEIILMSQEMSLKLLQSFNKLLLGRMDFQPLCISARQSNYSEAVFVPVSPLQNPFLKGL